MSSFKFIKIMENVLLLVGVATLLLAIDSIFVSPALAFFFVLLFILIMAWHQPIRIFMLRHKFEGGKEKVITKMPFSSIYNHTAILENTKVSFISNVILALDGSLNYEVTLIYDNFIFNETVAVKSIPISVNLLNWLKVVSFDKEYLYKNYHEPLATMLIRDVCAGEYKLQSNSIHSNKELIERRIDILKKEFGAA